MPDDTDPETMRMWIEMWRRASPQRRLALGRAQSRWCVRVGKEAIRRNRAGLNEAEVGVEFVRLHYGEELAAGVAERLGVVGRG